MAHEDKLAILMAIYERRMHDLTQTTKRLAEIQVELCALKISINLAKGVPLETAVEECEATCKTSSCC